LAWRPDLDDSGIAFRDIPVVFLSTHDSLADQAPKLGAAAYPNRPVMVDALLEVVERFANGR
jgi:CheY-like chemotaxis protein